MKTAKYSATVFGSTGLTGSELIRLIAEDDNYDKVYAVNRTETKYSSSKIISVTADLNKLYDLDEEFNTDHIFCCIGTTMKKAGSKAKFRKVDHDIPEMIAHFAQKRNVKKLIVQSSLGASIHASNFYLQIKGEMEEDLRKEFKGRLYFVRPSILLGKRKEFRLGEEIGKLFVRIFGFLLRGKLSKYRGIYARDVAKAMLRLGEENFISTTFESDQIHQLAKDY